MYQYKLITGDPRVFSVAEMYKGRIYNVYAFDKFSTTLEEVHSWVKEKFKTELLAD